MTPCVRCNRHVRDEVCPFCGARNVHLARISLARVARSALFAAAAAGLSECNAPVAFYGAVCPPDAESCWGTPLTDAATSDDFEWTVDASAPDAASDAESDSDSDANATDDAADD